MRILVLHSNVAADAPPDEQDTLVQAEAIAQALRVGGHVVVQRAFTSDVDGLSALLRGADAELVFNVVEAVDGSGFRAGEAVDLYERLGIAYTGNTGAALTKTCDKVLTKRRLVDAGLPTPRWFVSPDFDGLSEDQCCIVKSLREDASLGLDDGAVLGGRAAIAARVATCAAAHGGAWFAETFVDGREFNVAVLEVEGVPLVLPMAEMRFEAWPTGKPKIVGYTAKWDEHSLAATHTARDFAWAEDEPVLGDALKDLALRVWRLFALRGYARVDFRVDAAGRVFILEVNPNPCLEPGAGFAAAAGRAGFSYAAMIEKIVAAALDRGR